MPNSAPPRTSAARGRTREPALDGLRACAALAVLVTHVGFQTAHNVGGVLGSVTARLDLGVALFFALSGYLLGGPFIYWLLTLEARPSVTIYALRRAARIVPAYLVLLLLVRLIVAPVGLGTPREWVNQLAFLQIYGRDRLILGATHLWSLAVEVSFYVVLPVAALAAHGLLRRRPDPRDRARFLILSCCGVVGLSLLWPLTYVHGSLDPLLAPLWLPATAAWFAAGLGCAVFTQARTLDVRFQWVDEAAQAAGSCWALAGAAFALATTEIAGPRFLEARTGAQESIRVLLFSAVALGLLLPLTQRKQEWWGSRALSSPSMVWLGAVSYGVFLYQLVALDVAFRLLGYERFTGHFVAVLTVTTTMTLVLASVSWYLLERPILTLAHRRSTTHRAEAGSRRLPQARRGGPVG